LKRRTAKSRLIALIGSMSLALPTLADALKPIDVPAGELHAALQLLAKQADVELVFQPQHVKGLRTQGVKGTLSAEDALQKLLQGTQLQLRTDPTTGAMMIAAPPAASEASAPVPISQTQGATESARTARVEVEEIIVTAQKRIERLQDVPVPVTTISGATLATNNQLRLQDYYNKIPGLGLALIGDGSAPAITIRGITTGGLTNPTVGVVVDDVPYGTAVAIATAPTAPDIDPGDLARVEVLRGPQGTLYGAASMGGLLKFVTIDPSTESLRGNVQLGATSVEDGEIGYSVRGAINVPMSDTFAMRASAFSTRDPGYVDNVQTGNDDINRRQSEGGRLSALWQLSPSWSLRLSALVQNSEREGTSDVDVSLDADQLQQSALRGTGSYQRQTQAYSAVLSADLDQIELVSVTGYNVDEIDTVIDQTVPFFSGIANSNFGVGGVAGPLHRNIEKLTQEVRATLALGSGVSWLVGAFYAKEDADTLLNYYAVNPATGARAGTLFRNDQPNEFEEYAAFTNVTIELADRFDVQLGGRYSQNEQTFSAVRTGPLVPILGLGPSPSIVREQQGDDSAFTFLVTPRWTLSQDLMVYARAASGYRPGGPNAACGGVNIPCEYSADTTLNYELGMKGNVYERLLEFDASLYYIDWTDIQIPLTFSGLGYTDNAGEAKSQGIELAITVRPLDGLSVAAWGAYNDAELTKAFPSTSTARGVPGDRLPYSARVSGSLAIDQEFPLWNSMTGFAGVTLSHVGDRKGVFRSAALRRQTFASYTQTDLRLGLRSDAWTAQFFVNNLTDQRGILRSGLDSLRPTYLTYIQPRTLGLAASKEF
jgi:iron complex outermembrane recepter protein